MNTVLLLYTFNRFLLQDHLYERLAAELPRGFSLKAGKYRRWQDRQASLYGKLLLAKSLEIFNIQRSLEALRLSKMGRPFIPGCVDFNISHTDGLVVCAASEQGRVGVDTEAIKPINYADFRNVFHEKEWSSMVPGAGMLEKFYELWTLKEAVVKAEGSGLQNGLASWSVEGQRSVYVNGLTLHLNTITIHPDFKVALAMEHDSHVTVKEMRLV